MTITAHTQNGQVFAATKIIGGIAHQLTDQGWQPIPWDKMTVGQRHIAVKAHGVIDHPDCDRVRQQLGGVVRHMPALGVTVKQDGFFGDTPGWTDA